MSGIEEHERLGSGPVVRVSTFDDFVRDTGPRMMRSAVLLCGGRDQAEDLVQSTYAQVFAKWRRVSAADHPLAYARTMMTRLFISDRRRRRVSEVPLVTDAPGAGDPTALRLSLREALATLPPIDRAVVVLRYWEDLTVAQTAEQLGITESACRTRSSRALARLRTQYPSLADPEE